MTCIKKTVTVLFLFLLSFQSYSQFESDKLRLTLGLGPSAYMGELVQGEIPAFKQSSLSFSTGLTYDLTQQLRARLNLGLLGVKGDDKYAKKADLVARNLNFKSFIWDVSFLAEYDFVDKDEYNIVPYGFLGLGIFHFNPYTYDSVVGKVYLRDIGTEGQFLEGSGYPKPYSRTQLNVPFGLGLRYEVSETVTLGVEFNYRFLFTDYLDDVSSSTYVDPNLFLASPYYKSHNIDQLAYRLSYRADPKSDYNIYRRRGNPSRKDSYYSFQITATFSLGNLPFGQNSRPFSGKNRTYGY
jgi:hypothetical protein